MSDNWVRAPYGPNEPRPLDGPSVPHSLMSSQGSPVPLLKFQNAPRIRLSASKKKETRCACLSEAKDAHQYETWVEVSSSAPHLS